MTAMMFIGWFIIMLLLMRLGYYIAGHGWKRVHIHKCGYITEFYYVDAINGVCPMCGSKDGWQTNIGKMKFFGGYKLKE